MRCRIAGSKRIDRKQDNGGVDPRIAFDGVHLAIPRGKDEIEGEVAVETPMGAVRHGLLAQLVQEVDGPFLGAPSDFALRPVLVRHEHIVAGACHKRSDLAINNGSVSAPF